jgi:hypothetical protein
MIREDKFVFSHRPYAVDLGSLHITTHTTVHRPDFYRCTVQALWFRGRKNAPVSVAGSLSALVDEIPRDGLHAMEQMDDGRYGGAAVARWDGTGYWGEEVPEIVQTHLEILRPMLENFPAVPPCFDGWWTFQ